MPFASATRPSIQLGLLSAIADRAGFPTDTLYFNLALAAKLRVEMYERLGDLRGRMTGEWLFAPSLFGPVDPNVTDGYLDRFPEELARFQDVGQDEQYFTELRYNILPTFVEECFASVQWGQYRVVGFSSTFQQNIASLSLAKRIKAKFPHVSIVFGGANMEAPMGAEYARAFPFIDHVISGEADIAFPALLRSLADDGNSVSIDPFVDLNSLPVPSYGAYFDKIEALQLVEQLKPYRWMIPFEAARGCWWGQKQHCTFCGLNGQSIAFRSKAPERILAELSALANAHEITFFEAVDNILDLKYLEKLFPLIEQQNLDYRFFWETKSNLTRTDIRTLFRGGVRVLQPGIESMSSSILSLMRKGATMLQNVRCLKWCLYYGIQVNWNLIWGFPGETQAAYERELEVLRSIGHLQPPGATGRIWLERYAPYFTERERFPVHSVRPEASYSFAYPKHVNLEQIAYFFEYEMSDTLAADAHEATKAYVNQWQEAWNSDARHMLTYRRTTNDLFIDYRRDAECPGTYHFTGALALIYEYCGDTARSVAQIVQRLQESRENYQESPEDVQDALEEFCTARLMVGEDGKYLSLAIPVNPNW